MKWVGSYVVIFVLLASTSVDASPIPIVCDGAIAPANHSFEIDDVLATAPTWAIPRSMPFESAELRAEPFLNGTQGEGSRTPTVRVSGSREGRFGGRIFYIRRTGRTWWSSYRSQGEAVQGDPRALAAITSPATAYAFGFGRVGFNEMTGPDANEIKGVADAFDQKLQELGYGALPVRFVRGWSAELGSDRAFVEGWAYRAEIPIAEGGPLYFHDVCFHLTNIVLPEPFIRQSQRMFRRFIEFIDWARERASREPELAWFDQDWENLLFLLLGNRIDSGGGNFWINYANRFLPGANREDRESLLSLQRAMLKLSGLIWTPDQALVNLFSKDPHPWEAAMDMRSIYQRSRDWLASKDREGTHFPQLEALAKRFIAEQPSAQGQLAEAFYRNEGQPLNTLTQARSLLQKIDERRIQLSRAARGIMSTPR